MFFYTFIPKLLNMSLTASVAIVFVLLLRLPLRKAPKIVSYALWGVALFRLLCPVSIQSNLSLFGLFDAPTAEASTLTSAIEYVPTDIVHTEFPAVALPVPGISDAINDALPQGREQLAADPLEAPMAIATYVWMAGILAMAAYSGSTYLQLRRRLLTASPLRDNIYLVDEIASPFVMGLFRPKIYLPSSLEERERSYILLHEQHHIRRLDHVVKALAFAALCIHWFNPLVWLAFILAGKDMEMSCDEAVVRKMGDGVLADYTASLLSLATGKHIIAGMPLAFGEGDTKGRIHNLSNWKKPAFWVILVSVIACVVLAVCLLTNPKGPDAAGAPQAFDKFAPGTTYFNGQCLYMNPLSSYYAYGEDSGYRFTVDIPEGEWQAFPYTDQEWAALYWPGGLGSQNISMNYDEILYLPLDEGEFLLRVDGELWLVHLGSNEQMGAYLWSIYSLVPEYDLRQGELRIPAEDIGGYVFFTNSQKIAVTVQNDAGFDGSLTLLDISQGGAEIQSAEVTDGSGAAFTALSAARRYRIACEGLEGCTLTVSG